MDSKIIELRFTPWNFKVILNSLLMFSSMGATALVLYIFSTQSIYIGSMIFFLTLLMFVSITSVFTCYVYYFVHKRCKMKLTVDTEKKIICFENFVVLSKKHFLPLRPEKYICTENEIQKIITYDSLGNILIFVTDIGKIYVTNSCKNFHLFADWVFEQLKDKISIK